jgi:hypothetical protein
MHMTVAVIQITSQFLVLFSRFLGLDSSLSCLLICCCYAVISEISVTLFLGHLAISFRLI